MISKNTETEQPEENTSNICIEGTLNTKCYVPSLIGKTKAEVDTWSKTLPVKVNIILKNSISDESIVASISQASGTLLVEGSTITIKFETKDNTTNNNENNNNDENGSGNNSNDNSNNSSTTTPGEENNTPNDEQNNEIGSNTNGDSQTQIGG